MSYLFSKLAGYYDGFMAATGLSNEKRLLRFFGDVKNLKIGDIGGGTGTLAALLSQLGAVVTLIDPSSSMTGIAAKKCSDIKIIKAGAETIPVENEYFDIVCMRDCLHHVYGQEDAIREAARVLKLHGKMVIQEFIPNAPVSWLIYIFERLLGEKTRFFQPEKLKDMLACYSVTGQIHRVSSFEYVFEGCKIEQA